MNASTQLTDNQLARRADDSPDISPAIRVYGARTHNLRQIDVQIPLGQLTVVTGVSGSGKSSLVFDTIFAEGRHRYLSSVSTKSRELLQRIDRPDVDQIDGLPPVLCIEQQPRSTRKRATVATTSEIFDYLRLLFARTGQLHCPACHQPVTSQSRATIVQQALRLQDRRKVVILAPIVRGQRGAHADVFTRIVKDGYVRARVDGVIVDATAPGNIAKSKPHDIEIVVDRLIIKEGIQTRLEESIDLALQLGQGQCLLSHEQDDRWIDRLYSSRLACATCGTSFASLEPRSFSFNSPAGACTDCQGQGMINGSDDEEQVCPSCQGTRLNPVARSVLIDGISITDFCGQSPTAAEAIVQQWSDGKNATAAADDESLELSRRNAFQHLLPEIESRLRFLNDIGLDYLTLDRRCETLSAGEFQRTRLAACLASQLTGVCYILDEPTAGLHAQETDRLMNILYRLRDEGNTVLLVEHDLDVIRRAEFVIDLGPGAGRLGGTVLATGTPDELQRNPESLTGKYLSLQNRSPVEEQPSAPSGKKPAGSPVLTLAGATLHHLKDLTVEIPLGKFVCVTGVSGSGKTSLIIQTLVPALRKALGESVAPGGPFRELTGFESLSKLVRVDQSPLGRSARSSPATYTGLWDEVRRVFAKTREARFRGLTSASFSLHNPEARCAGCAGRGLIPVDEKRFSDWVETCPDCDGVRFAPLALSVRYRGKTVADVMELSFVEAALFFENFSRLAKTLNMLTELGLGYIKLGQSAATLSGGEAQRIKLATELAKTNDNGGGTIYVLDEPTAGLHAADVSQLVRVLRRLVESGQSVLVIEHNQELIKAADWRIEIGPGAGAAGGQVVFSGAYGTGKSRSSLG